MSARGSSNEIRLTRVYDAPLRAVWDAWTIPEQVEKWWGPRGFTLTTHSKDLRAGGTWRYTMHGPDGVDYPNVTKYLEVEPLKKLVYDHGGTDDRPPLFRVTVLFTEADGRTTMEMTSTLPTPEAAREMAKFIKQAGGNATWDRLAEHVAATVGGKQRFVINVALEAPLERVLALWSSPAELAKWLGGDVSVVRMENVVRTENADGQSTLFALDAEGSQPPLPTSIVLTAETAERTRVTVTSELPEDAAPNEVERFVRERPKRTIRWTHVFDALEALLGVGVEGDGRPPRLFHGTKADLKVGDLIEAGRSSNYGKRGASRFVYLTATLDAATWGAELAVGEGRGRIYVVEPTGPIEDDPNLTDKKFPGNPTKSYRTRDPLRITGELTDWQGHAPEQLEAMRDGLARLAAQGIEAIEE